MREQKATAVKRMRNRPAEANVPFTSSLNKYLPSQAKYLDNYDKVTPTVNVLMQNMKARHGGTRLSPLKRPGQEASLGYRVRLYQRKEFFAVLFLSAHPSSYQIRANVYQGNAILQTQLPTPI